MTRLDQMFIHKDYGPLIERTKPIRSYVDAQVTNLKLKYPTCPESIIRAHVQKTVQADIKRPRAKVLVHPSSGNTELRTVDLLEHVGGLEDRIITPSGSVYLPPTIKKSLIAETLVDKMQERNTYKHVMLAAAERGDKVAETNANNVQSSAKVFNNAIPGAKGSAHNALYDLPNYNSVTSSARHSVMCGYGHTERFMTANLYVTCLDDVINYCVVHHRVCPPNFLEVLTQHNILIPDVTRVLNYFISSLTKYTNTITLRKQLFEYLSRLPVQSLAFIYYAGSLTNLIFANQDVIGTYLDELFRIDLEPAEESVDYNEIWKYNKDLIAMISSVRYEFIDRLPIDKAIKAGHAGMRKIIATARHMTKVLETWRPLWTAVFRVDADLPNVMAHPNMIRKAVLVSDTDSVIFSTQNLVEWYARGPVFDRRAYEINGFAVWLLQQTLEHVFARISRGFGMVGEHRRAIVMKNEFLYPLLLRTPIPKHYAGRIIIQEGKLLPKPKKDIKGVALRGSKLCKVTITSAEEFILWMLDTISSSHPITASEIIRKVTDFERRVHTSLMAGDKTFLAGATIKTKESYPEPMKSNYFYHLMWENVFAERYGTFVLPNKGQEIPVVAKGSPLYTQAWMDVLTNEDRRMADRFASFVQRYPDKRITRIIIPPGLREIPSIFRSIIDTRKIVHANGTPFYLILRALGFGHVVPKQLQLVSDYVSGAVLPIDYV